MKENIFMVQGIYGIGGATAAMFRRADEFIKRGYKCFSISFDFTQQIYTFAEKNSYKINKELVLLNPFVELSNYAKLYGKTNNFYKNKFDLFYDLCLDKIYIEEVLKSDNNKILNILIKTKKGKSKIYFSENNLCIACENYNDNNEVISFIIYNYKENDIFIYKNRYDFVCSWFFNTLQSYNNKILICDGDATGPKISIFKNEKFKKFFVKHCNHTNKGMLTKTSEWLIKNNKLFDKIIILTKDQENDIKKYNISNTVVIPNFIKEVQDIYSAIDNYRIGFFARLTMNKGLKDAIYVVSVLVNSFLIKNIKLEIFGDNANKSFDEIKNEYNEIAKKLGVLNNISFNGYTKQPLIEMSKCVCVIFPSYSEAQGLSIVESMQVGTPVVAYDCNYGPRSIIKNNYNGFLCEVGDYSKMAENVYQLVKNTNMRNKMSINCREISREYNNDFIFDKWKNLFDEK